MIKQVCRGSAEAQLHAFADGDVLEKRKRDRVRARANHRADGRCAKAANVIRWDRERCRVDPLGDGLSGGNRGDSRYYVRPAIADQIGEVRARRVGAAGQNCHEWSALKEQHTRQLPTAGHRVQRSVAGFEGYVV